MKRQTIDVLKKRNSSIKLSIGSVFLKISDLPLILKLSKHTIDVEIIPYIKNENTLYIYNSYWVILSAIPPMVKAKFRISEVEIKAKYLSLFPNAEQKNKHLLYLYQSLEIEVHKTEALENLINELDSRLCYDWVGLSNTIQAFSFLADLKSITNEEKFFLYYKLTTEGNENDKLTFLTNSLNGFKNKLSNFKKRGKHVFIHGNNYNKNASIKFDDKDIEILKQQYSSGFRLSFRVIKQRLNTNRKTRGERQVSLQTVINAIKNLEDYGVLHLQRNGAEAINDLLLHPARVQAQSPGDQYQIDGSRFNIPFINEEGRPDILILVALIDVFSKKIVGFTLTKSENFQSYYEVISQAVKETCYLPAEILSDNLPALKSKESLIYLLKLKKFGVLIRQHTLLNPSDKSHIESWFGVFAQLYLKDVPGFLGDGIKSRRRDGKPNSDIKEKYRRTKNLRTKYELTELLKTKIIEYNSTYQYKNSTPNSLFATSTISNGIKLDSNFLRIVLFKEKTCFLIKAGIKIQVRNKSYEYLIYEENLPFLLKYLNKEIIIRYNESNMDMIYIYPTESFSLITTLHLHINFPLAQVNQTEADKARIRDFSLNRYAVKKRLLNLCKKDNYGEKCYDALPIEIISEKYDTKQLVDNSIKEHLLPDRKKQVKKVIKIKDDERSTTIEVAEPIRLSISKMFNLPGSNKLIN